MLDEILNERGSRYGLFIDVANATSEIQEAVYNSMSAEKMTGMLADQTIAIDMICHKLARIAVGDHNYVDNWIDIAGYAQLVADRLNGNAR